MNKNLTFTVNGEAHKVQVADRPTLDVSRVYVVRVLS